MHLILHAKLVSSLGYYYNYWLDKKKLKPRIVVLKFYPKTLAISRACIYLFIYNKLFIIYH